MLMLLGVAQATGWLPRVLVRSQSGGSGASALCDVRCLLDEVGGQHTTFNAHRLFLEPTSEALAESSALARSARSSSPALVDTYADYFSPLRQAPGQLRASDLEEVLQPDHMERLRFTNNPLQAYGALFRWEVLFDGLVELNLRAWTEIADRHSLPRPDAEDVQRAMGMRAERAIQRVFWWTDDWGRTRELSFDFYELYARIFREHSFQPTDGAEQWLDVLNEYRVPCCLCSRLDQSSTRLATESAGIDHLFQEVVCAEDGVQTLEETFLVAFVKIKRPPSRCVVFDNEPEGVTAAHDVLAKAVGLVGKHAGYELKHAEKRLFGLDEMTLMSLREVFSDDRAR